MSLIFGLKKQASILLYRNVVLKLHILFSSEFLIYIDD